MKFKTIAIAIINYYHMFSGYKWTGGYVGDRKRNKILDQKGNWVEPVHPIPMEN